MALTAGIILTSCSDNPSDEVDNKVKTDGEVGYLSLSLINSSVRSMTRAEGDFHNGIAEESKVNSVLVVLYDGADEVKYQFELGDPSSGDIDGPTPGTGTGAGVTYKTKAQEVIKANYKLAVFINYPEELRIATAKYQPLSAMLNAAEVTVDKLTRRGGIPGGAQDNFLMSNFAGLKEVPSTAIQDTETDAENAPIDLEVERAVAKVTLTVDDDLANAETLDALDDAYIGDIRWDVDVINKKTYWMRQSAEMLDRNNIIPSGGVTPTVAEVATKVNRIYMYATDPNWDNVSNSRKSGTTTGIKAEFTYKSGPLNLSYEPSSSSNPVNEEAHAYVTENTMAADDQWEDVTTTVLISAVITPKRTYFKEDLTLGDPYFLYNEMAFTLKDIQQIHLANNDEDQIIESAQNKMWKDIIKLQENMHLINLPSILDDMSTAFGGYSSLLSESKDVTMNNRTVSYFAKGAPNYYYVPIRHFSDDLQIVKMAYGRYGVVRNNWYNLTLNSINNYGTGEIPEDRPDPDDKEKSYLSIQFEILPWIERSQGIEL